MIEKPGESTNKPYIKTNIIIGEINLNETRVTQPGELDGKLDGSQAAVELQHAQTLFLLIIARRFWGQFW